MKNLTTFMLPKINFSLQRKFPIFELLHEVVRLSITANKSKRSQWLACVKRCFNRLYFKKTVSTFCDIAILERYYVEYTDVKVCIDIFNSQIKN